MMQRTVIVLLSAGLIAGCVANQNLSAEDKPIVPDNLPAARDADAGAPAAAAPVASPMPVILDVGLYQMQVPYGAISRSNPFWKHIEEQPVVDVATHDLLDKNGMRVGVGQVSDWPRFKKILDAAGAHTVEGHYIGVSASDQEIGVSGNIAEQHLFFFDHHGLSGRVYDDCQNLLEFAYGPSPNETHSVRLELVPVVRSLRRHYRQTVVDGRDTVDYVNDEQLFDLDLHVDLPEGKFLVVAPSAQSEREMSIGHQFLTHDATPGRRELVLIFVSNPRPVVREGTAAPMHQGAK